MLIEYSLDAHLVGLQIIWIVYPSTMYAVLPILNLITPFSTETGCDASSSKICCGGVFGVTRK